MYVKKSLFLIFVCIVFSAVLMTGLIPTVKACTKGDFDNAIKTTAQTISIQADGTVNPSTAPIQHSENVYTFTDNIYAPIVVEKDNIIIDGAGYTLQGPYNGTQTDLWIIGIGSNQTSNNQTQIPWTVGIDMQSGSCNLTIKNLNIKNFSIGLYLWTQNNILTKNSISENLVGILLSGNGNILTGNYIANNQEGIFFGGNQAENIPSNITLSDNGFDNNTRHLSGCVCINFNSTEATHTWDNGKIGNFWRDYNGADINKDGLGDTPYVIDVLNQDRYPLMFNPVDSPTVALKIPIELLIPLIALIVILIVAGIKRNQNLHKILC
jgi:parallel beta-helix repeat protein